MENQMMRQMMQSSIENHMMSQMLRGATITDSKEQVDTLGATITDSKGQVAQKVWGPDDDDRWDVAVIGAIWKYGQKIFDFRRTEDLSDVVICRRRVQ